MTDGLYNENQQKSIGNGLTDRQEIWQRDAFWPCRPLSAVDLSIFTFRVSRRRREMYCGHARLCVCVCVCVCLSAAACLHYCTDRDVTWGSGRGCPLVVHYWAICNRCTGFVAMVT